MRICLLIALILLVCCDSRSASPPQPLPPPTTNSADDLLEIAVRYQHFDLMTKEAVFVDPRLAALCRGASEDEVEATRMTSGPHAHTLVKIYMNDLAAPVFQKSSGPYPVGSVIVKEKKAMSYWKAGSDKW